jgi:hypothetical protein
MLSRVGSRLPKLTNRTIKRRETMHIKKQDHAHVSDAPVTASGDIARSIESFARDPGVGMIVVPSGLTIINRE